LKKIVINSTLIFLTVILSGCDGIFPTAPKSTVPSDHTTSFSGVLHKGGSRENMTPDECGDCHTTDLNGKVSIINGVPTWANSCYQCHGDVWKRNVNGGNKK
jgi:hypothetical protein